MKHILKLILPLLILITPALALAGSQSYTTPGTYTFTVPQYTGTLTVTVNGAGGGGGSSGVGGENRGGGYCSGGTPPGSSGGNSQFGDSLIAYGGGGGNTSPMSMFSRAPDGSAGSASGGDTNVVGDGASGGGGAAAGSGPGVGAVCVGGNGGNGGETVKTYLQGGLSPGSAIAVSVGNGGAGGSGICGYRIACSSHPGGSGAPGSVSITWSDSSSLSCSITFDQNPLTGNSTTMHYTSTGATLFYINNTGWVGASGSSQVYSTGDYSGTVQDASGNTASCSGVLSGPGGGGINSCTPASQTCGPNGTIVDNCGNTTTCQYGCSTTTNQCNATCTTLDICDATGSKVVNSCDGTVLHDCGANGQMCVAGQCVLPSIGFQSFGATNVAGQTFTASGHLQVAPSLVHTGDTARVYWNVTNADSCTVTGNNGDGTLGSGTGIWNTFLSGVSGKTTSQITGATTYTLLCHALTGATPSTVQESATVNILPSYQEL